MKKNSPIRWFPKPGVQEWLEDKAEKSGTSVSAVLEQLIEEHIADRKRLRLVPRKLP